MLKGRQRSRRTCFVAAWALCSGACQSALDLDRYTFTDGDAGRGALQTTTPLAPTPSSSDGQVAPVSAPAAAPSPLGESPPDATPDAGLAPQTAPPPTRPSPVALPPTRPVLVGDRLVDSTYVGTQEGGERRGICGNGTVMIGVSFYYYATGFGLGFLAPICGRFGDDPTAPLGWTRDDAADVWPLSDVLLGDPPPPPDDQLLGELVCPAPLVVAGARGNMEPVAMTYSIRDVTLECAPVYEVPASSQVIADRGGSVVIAASVLPSSGAEQYSIGCDEGTVAAGLLESSGSWVDGFALSCLPLRRPRIAGDACSAGDACQSGICDESGACAAILQ